MIAYLGPLCRRASVLAFSALLSGCFIGAGVPLWYTVFGYSSWAISGFYGYKAIQHKTLGEVSIGFSKDEESVKDEIALKRVSRPAVWPSGQADALIADGLTNARVFKSVVTPIQVAEALTQSGLRSDIKLMTEAEVLQTFSSVCRLTGADAVVFIGYPVVDTAVNYFSFKRPQQSFVSPLIIYSSEINGFVYVGSRRIEVEISAQGTKTEGPEGVPMDIIDFSAQATVEKLIKLTAPKYEPDTIPTLGETSNQSKIIKPNTFNDLVSEAQLQLKKKGYEPGPIDGIWGPQTRGALEKFQNDNGLAVTGELNPETRALLMR